MWEKYMHDIIVRAEEDGDIKIDQFVFGGDRAIVRVHPDQVPVLAEWLREAAEEIRTWQNAQPGE
jgi:hypothetical protein